MNDMLETKGKVPLEASLRAALEADDSRLRETAKRAGVFLNTSTLEVEIAGAADLVGPLLSILEAENFGTRRQQRLAQWKANPCIVNGEQLLAMIADVGKGRLARRLAIKAVGLAPPAYIAEAIQHVAINI